jgi:hypothetical protein
MATVKQIEPNIKYLTKPQRGREIKRLADLAQSQQVAASAGELAEWLALTDEQRLEILEANARAIEEWQALPFDEKFKLFSTGMAEVLAGAAQYLKKWPFSNCEVDETPPEIPQAGI